MKPFVINIHTNILNTHVIIKPININIFEVELIINKTFIYLFYFEILLAYHCDSI